MGAIHRDSETFCIKSLLCTITFLFMFTSSAFVYAGINSYEIFDPLYYLFLPSYQAMGILEIIIGTPIFIISLIGFYGAIKRNPWLLILFAIGFSFVLLAELASAILLYSHWDEIPFYLRSNLERFMFDYGENHRVVRIVDSLQTTLSCCGGEGPDDWNRYTTKLGMSPYPESCCLWNGFIVFKYGERFCDTPYPVGCEDSLAILFYNTLFELRTTAMMTSLIQLMGIICACNLVISIRSERVNRAKKQNDFKENLLNGYQPLGKSDPQTTYPVVFMQSDFAAKKPIDC